MAFDAGMLAACVHEIARDAVGGRIDRINQPTRDEVVLILRTQNGARRLLINAGPNNPRLGFTAAQADNPDKPPMFCIVLRKQIAGARIVAVRQFGFERACEIELDARDELGFDTKRFLIAEVMGKYSNLILTDEKKKVISSLKLVDFTTSSKRQVLPSMTYEMPPAQDKLDPMTASAEDFDREFDKFPPERAAEKFITSTFLGICAATAREIVFTATRHTDTPIKYCDREILRQRFFDVFERIKRGEFEPTLIVSDGAPVEYSFFPLSQYGEDACRSYATAGEVLDAYFGERDREQRVRQRASDLMRLLTNAESRIQRKLEAQRGELADCERGEEYKSAGDLITANIYMLSRGDREVELTDYSRELEDGQFEKVKITLDERLSPAANAQKYYKKYAKTKKAKIELAKQIAIGERELEYIWSVFDAMTHAESAADLAEIRDELYRSGYASKMKNYVKQKSQKPDVARFLTTDGMTVLCGKNNIQNEYITFRLADREDWWFHAKGTQGSHVLLVTDGREPTDRDFTEAAEIAAAFSRVRDGDNVAVDYTKAKNIKRPADGKPGLVIYHTNWTCYVTPDKEKINSMRKK
ncbi:MAG: fibronectin/fibrinogen-binding protein [Ruminococcaceae bacterium]|nr:fibronectin/fibrinogen-binding protein [Oscillospiraceae bacterium]